MRMLFVFFVLLVTHSLGQPPVVTGKIIDRNTDETLPYASISLSGNKGGTISNRDGNFTLGVSELDQCDSVIISYLGYRNMVLKPSQLEADMIVYLEAVVLELNEISVSSRTLEVEEVIDSVLINFPTNMEQGNFKKEIFVRNYHTESTSKPFMRIKDVDFEGLNEALIEELLMHVPEENVSYQDALFTSVSFKKQSKLLPVEAISLEEKTELGELLKEKLDSFVFHVKQDLKDSSIYYKVRSGIFNTTLNFSEEEVSLSIGLKKKKNETDITKEDIISCKSDSVFFITNTNNVKNSLFGTLSAFYNVENFEFLESKQKYKYKLEELSLYNGELVYIVSFSPKRRGLYRGRMCVSTTDYAILQLDYEFEQGKEGKTFQALGVGYHEKYKKNKLIFAEKEGKYYLKYLYNEEETDFSIERNITFSKKKKRKIGGKTLEELKIRTELFSSGTDVQEILVVNNKAIDSIQFQQMIQPACISYKKMYGYTPEMWQNSSIMEPVQELKTYKRKLESND